MVPATFARLLVPDLDASLPPLRRLARQEPAPRFTPRPGLEVAIVSRSLVIPGAAEDLEPFRPTQAKVAVASLPDVERVLAEHAAAVLRGPFDVLTGRALTARHADGAIVEYVEWRPDVRERLLGPV